MQSVVQTTSTSTALEWLTHPRSWPGQGDMLTWCHNMDPGSASILIIAGVIYLIWGFQLHKWLVMLNAALIGAWIGALLGSQAKTMGIGMAIGAVAAGAIAWPTMKYTVAVIGGFCGAMLGAAVWLASEQQPALAWAGAMTGLVFFGLLSFIVFRGSVITYMSLQGAFMLVFGMLGMLCKYQSAGSSLTSNMKMNPYILPIAVFIPAVLGLVYQLHSPGKAAAGAGGGSSAASGSAPAKK